MVNTFSISLTLTFPVVKLFQLHKLAFHNFLLKKGSNFQIVFYKPLLLLPYLGQKIIELHAAYKINVSNFIQVTLIFDSLKPHLRG